MQMKIQFSYRILIFTFATGLFFSSCKKEKDNPQGGGQTGTSPETSVTLRFHHKAGNSTFALNTDYTDDFGTVYRFTRAEFYLSGIAFYGHSDNLIGSPDRYFIIRPTTSEYSTGTTSATHIHKLKFNVGVDSVANHSDPTIWPSGHALTPQSPSMHWSWNSGYRFIVLEGIADRDADGTPETNFQLHIGTDDLLRNVELTVHKDILPGQANSLEIHIDYTKFFTGIELSSASTQTHTMNNLSLATQVADNISGVFSVH